MAHTGCPGPSPPLSCPSPSPKLDQRMPQAFCMDHSCQPLVPLTPPSPVLPPTPPLRAVCPGLAPPTPLDTVGLVDQRLGDAGTRDPGAQPPPASLPTHLAPDSSRWGSWVRGTSRSPGEPTSQTPPSRSCPSPQAPVLWAAPEGIQETARSLALADPNPCRDLWFCLHPGRQRHGPLGPPSAEGHRTGLER